MQLKSVRKFILTSLPISTLFIFGLSHLAEAQAARTASNQASELARSTQAGSIPAGSSIVQSTTIQISAYIPFDTLVREATTTITLPAAISNTFWVPETGGTITSYAVEGSPCTLNPQNTQITCSGPITKMHFTYTNAYELTGQGRWISFNVSNSVSISPYSVDRIVELYYPGTLSFTSSSTPVSSQQVGLLHWDQSNQTAFTTNLVFSDPSIKEIFLPFARR